MRTGRRPRCASGAMGPDVQNVNRTASASANAAMTCSKNSQPMVGIVRYPVRYRSRCIAPEAISNPAPTAPHSNRRGADVPLDASHNWYYVAGIRVVQLPRIIFVICSKCPGSAWTENVVSTVRCHNAISSAIWSRADQGHVLHQGGRDRGDRGLLVAGQLVILDLLGRRLVAHPDEDLVVEVHAAGPMPPMYSASVGLSRSAARSTSSSGRIATGPPTTSNVSLVCRARGLAKPSASASA